MDSNGMWWFAGKAIADRDPQVPSLRRPDFAAHHHASRPGVTTEFPP
jgi:hypothetical protein